MHVSLVTAVLLACSACTPSLRILSPTEGAMLDAGEDVAVLAEASRGSVRVNGEGADKLGAGLWTATVPGVDGGLGFAWAEVEGKDAIAVRSWHQGSFGVAGSWQEGAMQLVLGSEALCTGDPSVCAWVGELLEGQDLSGFVDNPLNVSGVEITVESAVAAGVDVSVESSEVLFVTIQLQDLVAEYTADAWLYTSSGTATFAQVDIVGSLFFEGADASLEPGDVQASEAVVEDDGALPSTIVDLLAAALQGEMEEAMAGAAVAATEQVVGELLAQAGPMPALTFDHPVSAEARASTASGSTAGLALTYDVLVFAETSAVASEE